MAKAKRSNLLAKRLTKRSVEAVQPPSKDEPPTEIWDTEVKGFHVRVPASGRAVYRFWYRAGPLQRVITLGPHGTVTADGARERAKVLAGAVAEDRDPAAEKAAADRAAEEERRRATTVSELVERWLTDGRDAAPNKRESSWQTDARKLRRHIVPLLGKMSARSLGKDDLAKAQRDIAAGKTALDEKTTKPRGRAIVTGGPGVARSALMSLSACLSWAVDQEIIASNPVARVKKLPKRASERFLSEVEAARLLDTLTTMEGAGSLLPAHGDVIRVLLLTGARRSEIADLSWDEVDLERGLLTLHADRHKSGGSGGVKHIVLSAPAAKIIADRSRIGLLVFPRTDGFEERVWGEPGESLGTRPRTGQTAWAAPARPQALLRQLRRSWRREPPPHRKGARAFPGGDHTPVLSPRRRSRSGPC